MLKHRFWVAKIVKGQHSSATISVHSRNLSTGSRTKFIYNIIIRKLDWFAISEFLPAPAACPLHDHDKPGGFHPLIALLAFRQKSFTETLSANVRGSSSSASSLWSYQHSEALLCFELFSSSDSTLELGSSGVSRYKCFNMKSAVS